MLAAGSVGKYQRFSGRKERRGGRGGGGDVHFTPACCGPTTESPRPHLPERGHTKAQRQTESCHNQPQDADRNEHQMIPDHTGAVGRWGGGDRPRSLTTDNVQSAPDKAARCDSRFSRSEGVLVLLHHLHHHPRRPERILLELFGERRQVNGQICSPVPGSGLLRSVSQRLLSTIGAGAGAGGARGEPERGRGREGERERERRGGGGSQSRRPPRGGAAWILQTRVRACARPRGSPARRREAAQ